MASRTVSKDVITLKGSAAIVSEFFGMYSMASFSSCLCILYNRGVYPEESFSKVKKYGLSMLLTHDEELKSYIGSLTSQLSEWLEAGKLQRIVLIIMSRATSEVLERWNFNIETDSEVVEKGVIREKSDKEIMREIQAIMRQIASSITYLPCLDEPCVIDVLAYTDKDVEVPLAWTESDAKLIKNPQMVKLHSFDTKIHKVGTLVSYKNDELDEE
ncbi:Mitotic spindle checkpoint protein MAD2 [Apostasia shenzhenica]|uniref:Mitotic spindle checkpoint protein MAD2 n=1 Tax=Apostasia shenzhenica TaxID=1088818 RepID=A0A2I0AIW9_9ASPA|nr:Mitotic spindle checkpoint protein MAD2 [Apostasia shenzhenica]